MSDYLTVNPITTSTFHRGESLESFVQMHVGEASLEGSVLAITSKLFSIAENQIVPRHSISKADLIQQDCDYFVCETTHGVSLTIKHGILIPTSGIDESNSETGDYLMLPKDPFQSLQKMNAYLRTKLGLKKFGLIMTDSHTHALRKGVTGIALAHWGFHPIQNLVGKEDLFGRKIKMTSVNVVDSLAVAAVLAMGEAAECRPLAVVKYKNIEFKNTDEVSTPAEIRIPLDEDLYGPILTALNNKIS